ncbi:hypothetical protein [Armatimonas sp.]|uniref:hypothetical protein n=1 Tax=Armatimonas sp. TaxID=1872638 RepID=UPI0037532D28
MDPKLLQQVLAGAGGSTSTSSEKAALVEAVASGKGRIDYSQGIARAVGLGALPPPSTTRSRAQDTLLARDAARADALQTLTMALQQVRVRGESRVSSYTNTANSGVRLKLAEVVKSAEVLEEKLLPEAGIFRVIVQVRLIGAGSVSEAIGVPIETKTATEQDKPRESFTPGTPAPPGVAFTGLIVDCRGLGLKSSPCPKLWNESDEEVFGTITVSDEFLQDQGIVAYPHSLEAARNSSRIGARPLIVRARRCRDSTRCEPILSASDAQRIQEANSESKFLERCAVVFVADP